MEPIFPLGDIRWLYVIIIYLVIIALLYSPEIWRLRFKSASWFWVAICTAVLFSAVSVSAIVFWPDPEQSITNGLTENLQRIDWAVEEDNSQHFEQELRRLYPILEKYGLQTPLIDPASVGKREYDSTWQGFHLAFLKVLRRNVRSGTFNLEQWNSDVERENAKRLAFVSDSEN